MAEPIVAQKAPFPIEVKVGRSYWWCACGRSRNQPFCDGSHAGTGLTPIEYKAEAERKVFFCGCKSSGKSPLCDGTHNRI
jgi:CDGSH-type Zn-finger protein